MPLAMEVGLGTGDIVLDGDPAPLLPPKIRGTAPTFRPMSIVAKRLDGLRCHLVRRPRRHCVRRGTSPPPKKGHPLKTGTAPHFSAHVYCGQIVDHLRYSSALVILTWNHAKLECGPLRNVMAALPNIGGALCSTPQSLADAHY